MSANRVAKISKGGWLGNDCNFLHPNGLNDLCWVIGRGRERQGVDERLSLATSNRAVLLLASFFDAKINPSTLPLIYFNFS